MDVIFILLGISLILFFGFLSEFLFKKTRIPDVLFLILLGIAIGPTWLNYINPDQIGSFAPVFTTFALLFLLYDGAFSINLISLAKGFTKSLGITIINFLFSSALVAGVMYLFGFDTKISILTGTILGGISSAFVIPVLKSMGVKGEMYSILTLESAMTDVFCIVFSLAVLEIIKANTIDFQQAISSMVSLFAVASFIGIIAGIVWILIVARVLKDTKSYMISIAYLILVYVLTEFLNGNGAIAALVLGLVLRNSKKLTSLASQITTKASDKKEDEQKSNGIRVTSEEEQFFYSEISFFLKTFFFVYIGLLIDFTDLRALFIGGIVSIVIMLSRYVTLLILRTHDKFEKALASSIFARGLAAAAIVQFLIMEKLEGVLPISNIVYAVIFITIILSSIRLAFIRERKI